jgi:hypothetical protein
MSLSPPSFDFDSRRCCILLFDTRFASHSLDFGGAAQSSVAFDMGVTSIADDLLLM